MPITSIRRADSSPRFKRSFAGLPVEIQRKVVDKIALFEADPQHPSLRIHKLKGKLAGLWSFYVDDRYRVLFEFVDGDKVLYFDVGTHRVYR